MNEDTKKFFEKLASGNSAAEEVKEENIEPKVVKSKETLLEDFEDEEGTLAIDVFQTADNIIIESPVAGLNMDDLDIEISPESVVIRGKRQKSERVEKKDYLYQECFWGRFSRSIILPQEIDPDKAKAEFKNGVLKILLPKLNRQKSKKLKIKFE